MGPDGQFERLIHPGLPVAEPRATTELPRPDMSKVPTAQAFSKAFTGEIRCRKLVWPARIRSDKHPPHRDPEGGQAGPRRDPVTPCARQGLSGVLGTLSFNEKGDIASQTSTSQ